MSEEFRDEESPTKQLPPQSSEEADSSKRESNITNEVSRRPRGRPPGSRNKRKSPAVLVAPKPDTSAMSPHVLQVSGGSDIVTAVTRFCNHHNTGLCVLSGSGTVSNVSVRQPTTTTPATVFGRFDLLSISATIFPSLMLTPFTNDDFVGKFVVSLAGQKGQTFGGVVVGPLIAVGTVYIVAASFNNPLYHRLPMEGDEQSQGSGGGDSNSIRHHVPPSTAAESLSIYSSHLPSADVMWTPIPRPHSSFC